MVMLRLLVVIAALFCSLDCSGVQAQRYGRVGPSHSQYGNAGSGFAYPIYDYGRGYYGYVYDPYARGSFKMYDPADDPYLRAKYKYDTFFPGRRSRRRSSILRRH
jgi:hypothetical protein